jgi:isopentenyldiphosphate isomerase
MQEEFFDIVDEKGVPTGQQATRQEAHAKGLWHRAVHIYCVRKNGDSVDFMVHLRAKTKDRNPDRWDTRFGGHVSAGETVEQTVLGELKEETGLVVSIDELIQGDMRVSDHGANREFNYVYFLAGDRPIESIVFQDGEVQEVKWMSAHDIVNSLRVYPEDWSGMSETFGEICNWISKKLV